MRRRAVWYSFINVSDQVIASISRVYLTRNLNHPAPRKPWHDSNRSRDISSYMNTLQSIISTYNYTHSHTEFFFKRYVFISRFATLNFCQHPSVDSAPVSHSHIHTKSWTPKTLVTRVEMLSKNTCKIVAPSLCMNVFIFMDRTPEREVQREV
jgi:hypothetical protein